MAVYSKLLLGAGGGIISPHQQADQVKNTVTILIGLGGTGIDCIRTIKTQVYTRLKPDNPDEVEPSYSHIRFLGVDSNAQSCGGCGSGFYRGSRELLPLDETEFFSIFNNQIDRVFSEDGRSVLQSREDLTWMDWEHVPLPFLLDEPFGAIRQLGRFLLMDKSDIFYVRLEQEINAAKRGLKDPQVYIHIFSGLSGGTGSGCLLDVCYMARDIAKKMGNAAILGYFFLPDVNLANIPYENIAMRNHIPKNGYATMQELDYCMNLPHNGGSFTQTYKGGRTIDWNTPPVDMCHLISATNQHNEVIPDAYNYALNVTAEYVTYYLMDFAYGFGLPNFLSTFRTRIAGADASKYFGAQMAYCMIGTSSVCIPFREINTYLASALFSRFSVIAQNTPSRADVENLAISALAPGCQGISAIYDCLFREIQEGTSSDYAQYAGDWKFVQNCGNHEMVNHYVNQTASKGKQIEANAQNMLSLDNQRSLLGRLTRKLNDILGDFSKGPIYAYRTLAAAERHSFLNFIDGLIHENQYRADEESWQSELRQQDYENARSDFENRKGFHSPRADQKRFESYEYYLLALSQHNLSMEIYEQLDMVLQKFREQIVDITASYYVKLSRVMETLLNTFKENRDVLTNQKGFAKKTSFITPLITVNELKPMFDTAVSQINIYGMFYAFMRLFIDNSDGWLQEDESKITRMVTDFFVNNAFSEFAGRTITSFLRDKYENKTGGKVTDTKLSSLIYEDWMKLLTSKASPLFYSNNVWHQSQTSKLAVLLFPAQSAPVQSAANQLNAANPLWNMQRSSFADRIRAIQIFCGFPLSSYENCREYGRMYYSGVRPGQHIYGGKLLANMPFSDWNKLPPITPVSVIDYNKVPNDLRHQMERKNALYEKAVEFGILDADSVFYRPVESSLEEITHACDACCEDIDNALDTTDIPILEKAVLKIEELLPIRMEKTGDSLPNDGFRRDAKSIQRIQKDYFCASPGYHETVAKDVKIIDAITNEVRTVIACAREKLQILQSLQGFSTTQIKF